MKPVQLAEPLLLTLTLTMEVLLDNCDCSISGQFVFCLAALMTAPTKQHVPRQRLYKSYKLAYNYEKVASIDSNI